MTSNDEQLRIMIAEQASEWFVANDEASLGDHDSVSLVAWLKTSPVHVEEFLGVAAIARDLRTAGADPESSLDDLIACARAEEDARTVRSLWSKVLAAVRLVPARRWRYAGLAMAAAGATSIGLLLWNLKPVAQVAVHVDGPALHFQTRHGEQQSYRLADDSVLHLNTDSAATVRYTQAQRLVILTSGEAAFEVTHEPNRVFRVLAGPAEVVDLGTRFDVRRTPPATVVTVMAGRVAVEVSGSPAPGQVPSLRSVQLSINQQLSVEDGKPPGTPATVDAERTSAWLHRQIVFEREPLERVAAEFNRYSSTPIEITAPELRDLEVSGVFSTDDIEEFLAFLRSLEGVRVDVTATRIRVSQR